MGKKKHKPRSSAKFTEDETKFHDVAEDAGELKNFQNGNESGNGRNVTHVTSSLAETNTQSKETDKESARAGNLKPGLESLHENEVLVFPRHFHWAVFVWTLVIRLWYVVTPANWWILHPDEVYQTVEVAHSEAFGYGFRPYEYLPPPGNIIYSAEHARTIEMGMYSLRSFLLVKLLSIPMVIADTLGVPASPFLVTKVVHAIMTSCLPIAVFKFCRAMRWSRDTATLAAIFTSFSLTLNVLGTHTLINSFISPFVFFSLIPLASAVSLENEQVHEKPEINKSEDRTSTKPDDNVVTNGIAGAQYGYRNKVGSKNEYISMNGHSTIGNGCANGHGRDHLHGHKTTFRDVEINGFCGRLTAIQNLCKSHWYKNSEKLTQSYANGHLKGYLGNDVNANIVKKRVNYTSNSSDTGRPSAKKTRSSVPQASRHWLSVEFFCMNKFLLGILFGMCVYVRTDVILLPLVVGITFKDNIFMNIYRLSRELLDYAIGFACAMLIGGHMDNVTYGVWFISMKQWFKFNIWNSFSASQFGEGSWVFYINKLVEHEPLAAVGCFVLLLDIFVAAVFNASCKSKSTQNKNSISKNTSYAFFILLCIYSLVGHKEVRFMHNVIVFLYISSARAVYRLCKISLSSTENQSRFQYYAFTYSILTLLFSSQLYAFIKMDKGDISKWTYGGTADPDVNICMDFIRRQGDVDGVFMDRPLFSSAGYSALHKDVSIFALNKYEFTEYDKEMRITNPRFFSHNISVGFSVIGRISEFVSVYNTPYVVKMLILKPQYNYVVLEPDRRFLDIGFVEVFRTENARVLKRSFTTEDEEKLADIAKRTPIGTNATILEYEGDWLRHFGLFKKAEQRLIWSNRIDKKRLGPFQILLEMFELLGDKDNYNRVLKACLAVHTEKRCLKPYVPIKLHSEYFRKKEVHLSSMPLTNDRT